MKRLLILFSMSLLSACVSIGAPRYAAGYDPYAAMEPSQILSRPPEVIPLIDTDTIRRLRRDGLADSLSLTGEARTALWAGIGFAVLALYYANDAGDDDDAHSSACLPPLTSLKCYETAD